MYDSRLLLRLARGRAHAGVGVVGGEGAKLGQGGLGARGGQEAHGLEPRRRLGRAQPELGHALFRERADLGHLLALEHAGQDARPPRDRANCSA